MARRDMTPINTDTKRMLTAAIETRGFNAVAKEHGVHRTALQRALTGAPVTESTAKKLAKPPTKVRDASEFAGAGAPLVAPKRKAPSTGWGLERIAQARKAQMRGQFALPVDMARAMTSDSAIFPARQNRVSPQTAISTKLEPHASFRGKGVARKAAEAIILPKNVLVGIHRTLVDHGIAIGYVQHEPNEEGTVIGMRLTEWPLEHVKYNESTRALETPTDGGDRVPIMHGNGRWIVFRKTAEMPWATDACVLSAGVIWAAHNNGVRDWAAASFSHGQAKIIGELPEGVPTHDESGSLSPEALHMLTMLQDLVSGEVGAGLRSAGSKTDFLANGSTAWQVFKELILNREKAAARVYNGTDAMLGSVGGAPGVDIAALFGVATTLVQGDLEAIEDALTTGLYQPWTAINEGDSRYAPRFKYLIPDVDADAKSEEQAKRRERLHATIKGMRDLQLEVDQEVIDKLAAELGVVDPPRLAALEKQTAQLQLAPTDVARVVRVREARASQGLPPLGDERDDLFLSELEAKAEASATQPAAP